KTELYYFDFNKFEVKQIWSGYFLNQIIWSPDGQRFLVLAGPSTFGKLGVNVPKGMIPNDYDTQAYLFDTELKNGEAISRNFDPSINSAIWSEYNGQIYFNTTDHDFHRLYQYNLSTKAFTLINTNVDVVNSYDIARKSPRMVFLGQGAYQPEVVYTLDLQHQERRPLLDLEQINIKSIKFGNIDSWQFTNQRKVKIDGRIYYPPDFDAQKKYPCIVYYYGGTSPVTRNFGGRYPMEYYAAQGYVVYILQPSGAVGFGQAFSALHVNDWGKIVADEIIDGVKQFLKAHPFVDAKRVGCMGASFGGFMTQLLLTRTDIFAVAVSHAGISALSSYWGEGYWGYTYSAVATANSFPWNRKDIYVNQSPLFAADKIVTPLLLTHGASDTNVPPGESEQMYVALKLLGKTVEYLKFDGQNHFIADYGKRKLWTKSIIAWFDKWLKDQPQFWEELYPPAKK
ncbi:S9 family peptidase, partial [candidate division KSB1 bacterium]|nr:S9 family peptidase [candidate division KSB1 bacterium]